MPLVELNLLIDGKDVPRDIRAFLREARRRIDLFQRSSRVPGFVACDFEGAYSILHTLAAADVAPGRLFCEWGSGFGVVACLAAMLEFDACGIEIDGELVDAARQLTDDFDLPVEFVHGSFLPKGSTACLKAGNEFSWLTTDEGRSQNELGLTPDDFGVIFAYPWPDEERLIGDLFERYATPGAILVTHHGGDDFRLRRKKAKRSSGF